jgi:hypothetical protein
MNPESVRPNLDFDFDAYEQEVAHIDFKANAHAALNDIMTVKKPDGTDKTRQDIEQEVETFFRNDTVVKDMGLLRELERAFVDMCASHGMADNGPGDGETVGTLFNKASQTGHASHSGHDHDSGEYVAANGVSKKGRARPHRSKPVRQRTVYEVWQIILRYYRGGLFGR